MRRCPAASRWLANTSTARSQSDSFRCSLQLRRNPSPPASVSSLNPSPSARSPSNSTRADGYGSRPVSHGRAQAPSRPEDERAHCKAYEKHLLQTCLSKEMAADLLRQEGLSIYLSVCFSVSIPAISFLGCATSPRVRGLTCSIALILVAFGIGIILYSCLAKRISFEGGVPWRSEEIETYEVSNIRALLLPCPARRNDRTRWDDLRRLAQGARALCHTAYTAISRSVVRQTRLSV
jgi:hypothetical protein